MGRARNALDFGPDKAMRDLMRSARAFDFGPDRAIRDLMKSARNALDFGPDKAMRDLMRSARAFDFGPDRAIRDLMESARNALDFGPDKAVRDLMRSARGLDFSPDKTLRDLMERARGALDFGPDKAMRDAFVSAHTALHISRDTLAAARQSLVHEFRRVVEVLHSNASILQEIHSLRGKRDWVGEGPSEDVAETASLVQTEEFQSLSLSEKIEFLYEKAKTEPSLTRKDFLLLFLALFLDYILNVVIPQLWTAVTKPTKGIEAVRQIRKEANKRLSQDAAEWLRIVTVDRLPVFAQPRRKSSVLDVVDSGQIVYQLEKRGPWCNITVDGETAGWVKSKYLVRLKRSSKTRTSAAE